MKQMDEYFVKLRNKIGDVENKNIYKKVHIRGEELEFEEVKFFDDKLAVMLPKSFDDMSEELIKYKYPSINRPPIIKSDKEGSVNITLNLVNIPFHQQQIEDIQKEIKNGLKKMNPSVIFYDEEVIDNGHIKIGYYDFKSVAIDGAVYNLNFMSSIDNKMFLGTFNCEFSNYMEWKPVILQIIYGLKDLGKYMEG